MRGTYAGITERDGEAPEDIVDIPKDHVSDAARKRIEANEAAKALRLGAPGGLAGHKVEQALDLDLDDGLDDRRVAVDEELAEHVRRAQHHVKVVTREHVLDVPQDLVVVFLVFREFRRALDVEVEQAPWRAGNQCARRGAVIQRQWNTGCVSFDTDSSRCSQEQGIREEQRRREPTEQRNNRNNANVCAYSKRLIE